MDYKTFSGKFYDRGSNIIHFVDVFMKKCINYWRKKMIPHKLKVNGIDLAHAKISVDDVPMRCSALKVDMAVGQIHSATIEMETLTVPEIEIDSWVTLGFTPETVEQAIAVLKSAFKNNDYAKNRDLIRKLEKMIEEIE